MSLIAQLHNLSPHRILDIKNLVDKANVEITFWGSPVVSVAGFESAYIDDIATRILVLSQLRFNVADSNPLSPGERIAGLEIVKKLKEFYIISDREIKNSNFFSKLLKWIGSFFNITPYGGVRFELETRAENNFLTYSHARFLQEFKGDFDEEGCHPDADGAPDRRSMVIAKESSIRNLLLPVG